MTGAAFVFSGWKRSWRRIYFPSLLAVAALALWSCGGEKDIEDMNTAELRVVQDSLVHEEQVLRNMPRIVTATVKPGEGMFQTLQQAGVDLQQTLKVIRALSDSVELSKLQVGQSFQVGFRPDDPKNIAVFRYAENPARIHLLFADSAGAEFRYDRVEKPVELRHSVFEGTLEAGANLHQTLYKIGIPGRMVNIVTGVLMCKVNFSTDARVGDKFKIMLEETWFQDSVWIGGKVLYAGYQGKRTGNHEAFRYEDPDPKSTFNAHYTEKGEALIFSGMRYPLDRLHITSPFGWRIHPVKGTRDFHNGVDYGSPSGSPVYAVADGKVIISGYDQYSGNKIAVQHADRTSSWYLHLSVRGVHAGQKVNARQVIGRVGNTGRSTGPHLHFGFKQPNGAWMNPLTKKMIAAPKLEGERMQRLTGQIALIRKGMAETEAHTARSVSDTTNATVKSRKVQKAS